MVLVNKLKGKQMTDFTRKMDRYLVIKTKDVYTVLSDSERKELFTLLEKIYNHRQAENKLREYVVVKDTMSIYEKVWELVEKEVTNTL